MTSLIIVSFSKESQAIEASRKLSQLEAFGDLTIYERVIVKKKADGNAEVLQADITDGLRSISGMPLSTLAAAMGGPVGMVLGILSGSFEVSMLESNYFGFSDDFEMRLATKVQTGELAIVAEVDEENPVFINGTLGGLIMRTDVDYEYDQYLEHNIESIDEEIATLRARLRSAVESERPLIQQKTMDLKEKRRRKLAELEKKTHEKISKLRSGIQSNTKKSGFSIHEFKIERLKSRIHKHQAILAELEDELKAYLKRNVY